MLAPLLQTGAVKRCGRGRPRMRPRQVVADKGHTGRANRRYLARRGMRATVAHQRGEKWCGRFDAQAYRQRNRIERCSNWLKQYRRTATRYEKRAANYLAMLTLVTISFWL